MKELLQYTTVSGVPYVTYCAKEEDIERLGEDLLIVLNPIEKHHNSRGIEYDCRDYLLSRNDGKTWRKINKWTGDLDKIKKVEKNKQDAFKKRDAYLKENDITGREKVLFQICKSCATKEGELGIMQFKKRERYQYQEARVWVNDDGIEEYGNMPFSGEATILKCDRCGKEDYPDCD